MQWLKKNTIIETIRLNRLHWFGHVQRMEGNRIPKKVLYMNLETTSLRGRLRNRWQDEVREDRRLVGGKGWKERVYNREEWKKFLRTAQNHCILQMPMEWMNLPILFILNLSSVKVRQMKVWAVDKGEVCCEGTEVNRQPNLIPG